MRSRYSNTELILNDEDAVGYGAPKLYDLRDDKEVGD